MRGGLAGYAAINNSVVAFKLSAPSCASVVLRSTRASSPCQFVHSSADITRLPRRCEGSTSADGRDRRNVRSRVSGEARSQRYGGLATASMRVATSVRGEPSRSSSRAPPSSASMGSYGPGAVRRVGRQLAERGTVTAPSHDHGRSKLVGIDVRSRGAYRSGELTVPWCVQNSLAETARAQFGPLRRPVLLFSGRPSILCACST